MKKSSLFTTLLFFHLLPGLLHAQSTRWQVDTLDLDDGLAANAVRCILKDRQGFMWFGTVLGLHLYDGYAMKIFKHDPVDSVSLAGNDIRDMVEDLYGHIWIATTNGLCKFNPRTEKFRRYQFVSTSADNSGLNRIERIYMDRTGTVWAGSARHLIRIDPATEHYQPYLLDLPEAAGTDPGMENSVTSICEDRHGTLWVGTGNSGMYKMDRKKGAFEHFIVKDPSTSKWDNFVTEIFEDRSAKLWVATLDGLYQFDRRANKYRRLLDDKENPDHPDDQRFAAIGEDKDGYYWIRTYSGLYCYKRDLGKFLEWKHAPESPQMGAWKNIRSIWFDDGGVLWCCAGWKGIVKLSPSTKPFRYIQVHPAFEEQDARAFLLENDVIWMGSPYGLSRYDRSRNTYSLFQHDPEDPGSLSHNFVWEIYRDHVGDLWISTLFGLNRLIRYNENAPIFVRYLHDAQDKNSISGNTVGGIYEGPDHILLISTHGGIDVYNRSEDSFLHLVIPTVDTKNAHLTIRLMEEDKMWVNNSNKGIFLLYFPLKRISQYTVAPDSVICLDSCIYELPDFGPANWNRVVKDANGSYWVTTMASGFYQFALDIPSDGTCQINLLAHYSEKDGLCHNHTESLLRDNRGNIWVGTANGLSKFDPVHESFTNYDPGDGLSGDHLTLFACKSPEGEMFFRSQDNGMLAFYPDSIQDNAHVPPVVITDLKILNKPVPVGGDSPLQTSISRTREITLAHNQNFLSFEFAALNYIRPDKNRYKYMMLGLDEDWIVAGTRRYASYPDLKPGEYTFRVIGSNNDNQWNTEGASLEITILPPWWATAYAYVGYAAMLLLLVTGYIHFRTRQLRKDRNRLEVEVDHRTRQIAEQKELLEVQNEKIREMDRTKTRFFTHVSHEFRTPISLIQGPVDDLLDKARLNKKEMGKLQMVSRNAGRLLNLVNQLLDIAKLESGTMKLKLSQGDLMASLRTIAGSFSSLAETKGILYSRSIPRDSFVTWFDTGVLEKILVNLLSNAFKFTPEAGEITFTAKLITSESSEIPDQIECRISDQGPGIPEDEKEKIFSRFYQVGDRDASLGTGIGLSLAKDLVNLWHGDITVESEEGSGSTFIVRLPLGVDHLKENEYVLVEEESDKDAPCTGVAVEADIAQPSDKPAEEVGESGRPILLIVEDNPDIRSHIREHLEEIYDVVESVNGQAGLVKALEVIPDMVVTDLMMPVMDGVELCKQLKNDERTSHVPVIMLTAKTSRKDKLEGLETGADDYIPKPFNMQELKVRIANLVAQRKKLRERYSREITLEPKDVAVTSVDEAFLQRAIRIVEDRMADDHFDMEQFQEAMHMSHSTLFRKLQALTDQSPTVFVRNIRLKRAAQLLRKHYGNVASVSYAVGFDNPSYFSKCFRELYGVSPASFCRKKGLSPATSESSRSERL